MRNVYLSPRITCITRKGQCNPCNPYNQLIKLKRGDPRDTPELFHQYDKQNSKCGTFSTKVWYFLYQYWYFSYHALVRIA